jgi:hypothetical protein
MRENEGGEMVVDSPDFPDNKNYQQFCDDMYTAGYEPTLYHGRWFYKGPAVVSDTIGEVMAVTTVECQSDNMGLGYVIYPV